MNTNDDMGKYIAENTLKQIIKENSQIKGCKVLVMGIIFKKIVYCSYLTNRLF